MTTHHLPSDSVEATTSSVTTWPTRVPGDPSRWLEGGDPPEVCPVHEYLLEDGYCEVCATTGRPEKSVR